MKNKTDILNLIQERKPLYDPDRLNEIIQILEHQIPERFHAAVLGALASDLWITAPAFKGERCFTIRHDSLIIREERRNGGSRPILAKYWPKTPPPPGAYKWEP